MDRKIKRLHLQLLNLLTDLKGDLSSCYNRANYFIRKSYIIDLKIIFVFVAAFFVLLVLRSGNPTTFLINLINSVIVGVITFFVYCISDTFWFLINKRIMYRSGILDRRYIKIVIDKLNEYDEVEPEDKNLKAQILMTAVFNADGYKSHIQRNAIEILALLLILLIYFPNAFLLNLVIFGVMYVYVSLYERGYMEQIVFDLIYLAKLIRLLHKENPAGCKRFILKHKIKEIRDLKLLYRGIIVSRRKIKKA